MHLNMLYVYLPTGCRKVSDVLQLDNIVTAFSLTRVEITILIGASEHEGAFTRQSVFCQSSEERFCL